jgi:hypothetical protein
MNLLTPKSTSAISKYSNHNFEKALYQNTLQNKNNDIKNTIKV